MLRLLCWWGLSPEGRVWNVGSTPRKCQDLHPPRTSPQRACPSRCEGADCGELPDHCYARQESAEGELLCHDQAGSRSFGLAGVREDRDQDVSKMVLWGNHSPTMFPDLTWATVKGTSALDLVGNEWYNNKLIPRIQKRGAEIIEARGLSSAASAGNAALAHMRSWFLGHNNDWISFGAWSTGNPYNIADGIYYSFPVTVTNRKWSIVNGLQISPEQRVRMDKSAQELLEERKAIESMLKI